VTDERDGPFFPGDDDVMRLRTEVEELRKVKALDGLLATLTDVLDVRKVFDRVSDVARPVLPHDALILGLVTPDRQSIRIWAHSTVPEGIPVPAVLRLPDPEILTRDWDFMLFDDITASEELRSRNHPLLKFGFRSVLRVPLKEDGVVVGGLNFVAFRPGAYSGRDVLIARRIADFVHLALTHHRMAEEAQRAGEAQERARQLESRIEGLAAELSARGRPARIVGVSGPWRRPDAGDQGGVDRDDGPPDGRVRDGQGGARPLLTLLAPRPGRCRAELRRPARHAARIRALRPRQRAFTGAHAPKPGRIELAQGGVLFLDEVGEMSPSVQAKLLRVLQEREFQRLGGTRTLKADLRVVAATNRDLRSAMARGTFREDLFYRLAVFEIRIPALRERPDDILPLAGAFLEEVGADLGRPAAGISRDAKEALLRYAWPGNARELRNVLERASILCDGGLVTREHLVLPAGPAATASPADAVLPASLGAATGPGPSRSSGDDRPDASSSSLSLADMERAAIQVALAGARQNKSRAARTLGLTRGQLYGRLRRLGLRTSD
jgi:transcriptional regulator with GAF, ATPase, and Fis domain